MFSEEPKRRKKLNTVYIGKSTFFKLRVFQVVAIVFLALVGQLLIIMYFMDLMWIYIWFIVNRIAIYDRPSFNWKYMIENGQLYASKAGFPAIENSHLKESSFEDDSITTMIKDESFTYRGTKTDFEMY